MFFDDWEGVGRTLWVGTAAYVALIALLRISGKRTLSQLNAFDFVVTVALGSTLAAILLDADVALVEGVTALALLIALQYAVTWTSARSNRIREGVRSSPTMVAYRGELLPDALKRQRVTDQEVRQVLRQQGVDSLEGVGAVVLESDGSFAVLSEAPAAPGKL